MAPNLSRIRRSELTSLLGNEPYNSLLRDRYAHFIPEDAKTFYTISCGKKGIMKSDSEPTGVIFTDDSFIRIFEKWSVKDNALLGYSYHYQVPYGVSIRYDMDTTSASASHPRHHLQTSALGDNVRLPTGEVRCEEVLQMIFEQFVDPKQQQK